MVSVEGIYQNGHVTLKEEYVSDKPVKVIVTFLEDIKLPEQKGLSLSDFSFSKSRQALSSYKGSFIDAVAEERRDGI